MKPRDFPLPADMTFIIDSAVDHGHITPGARVACTIYGDTDALDAIINKDQGLKGWRNTAAMATELEIYAATIIPELAPRIRDALNGLRTYGLLKTVAEYSEHICWTSFEDEIWGGFAIDMRNRPRENRNGFHKRTERRVYTDGWVKRAVRCHHHEIEYVHKQEIFAAIGPEFHFFGSDCYDLLNGQRQEYREEFERREQEFHRALFPDRMPRNSLADPKKHRKIRGIVKRASNIAAAIIGPQEVSRFASGEEILIESPEGIDIKVHRNGSITNSGHGAVKVALYKEGNFLSNLCVYQDLPALDQLASLALHAKSGAIVDVVKVGNLYNIAPAANDVEMLSEKAVLAEEIRNQELDADIPPPLDAPWWSRQTPLKRKYAAVMGSKFLERTFLDFFGRRYKEALSIYKLNKEIFSE